MDSLASTLTLLHPARFLTSAHSTSKKTHMAGSMSHCNNRLLLMALDVRKFIIFMIHIVENDS
jgi:hypothetical protein